MAFPEGGKTARHRICLTVKNRFYSNLEYIIIVLPDASQAVVVRLSPHYMLRRDLDWLAWYSYHTCRQRWEQKSITTTPKSCEEGFPGEKYVNVVEVELSDCRTFRNLCENRVRNVMHNRPISAILPLFANKLHCRANKYILKSNTEIVLASIISRYGFLSKESSGTESSDGASSMTLPNHKRFLWPRARESDISSSSYWTCASSRRLISSYETAKLSYST